jgi:tetratricopeptide (TPR) repeat protein
VLRLLASEDEHPPGSRETDLARLLQKETAGNPFFVTEIIRHLAESGTIIQHDGGWTPSIDLRRVGIPGSVRDVTLQRVARLGDDAANALSAATVIGRDFDLDVLARVCPNLGEDDLIELLDRAVDASLLIEVGGATECYRFVHVLIQRSLYADLSCARRRRIHHRVAEALEALHQHDLGPHVGALAHHWTEAAPEDPAKARLYAQRAGEAALAQSAPDEAVRWFVRALELAPDGREADVGMQCELLIQLGAAQRQVGDGRYRETLLEAAAAAQELGDRDRMVDAALANNRGFHSATGVVDAERVAVLRAALSALAGTRGPARALLLATLAVELTYGRDWVDRRRLADEALTVARRVGDEATLARVLTLRFYTLNVPETVGERQAEATEALAFADEIDDPVLRGYATWFRMWACCEQGDIAEADRRLEELRVLTDRVGPSFLRYAVAFSRSWRALLAGRTEEAETLATDALQLGNESGQPESLALFASQLVEIRRYQGRLGEVVDLLTGAVDDNPGIPGLRAQLAGAYCELGRHSEAAALLDADIVDGFTDFPYDPLWLVAMSLLAEACARLGRAEPATLLYRRLAPWRDQMPYAGSAIFGSVNYYLGLLATTMGLFDEAERHFSEAAAHHERIGAAYWLAVTRLGWAGMLKQRQCPADAARAASLRDQTLAAARELGFTVVERDAAALL